MVETLFLLVAAATVNNCIKVNFLLSKSSGRNIVLAIQSWTHLRAISSVTTPSVL